MCMEIPRWISERSDIRPGPTQASVLIDTRPCASEQQHCWYYGKQVRVGNFNTFTDGAMLAGQWEPMIVQGVIWLHWTLPTVAGGFGIHNIQDGSYLAP